MGTRMRRVGLQVVVISLVASTAAAAAAATARITESAFGTTEAGEHVNLYVLKNTRGAVAKISDYGGIVVSLDVPDRDGDMGDVVLGFASLEEYVADSPYFGCIVGRYGNRIGKSAFTLDGETYSLTVNDGPNHLHGGAVGFDKVVWDATTEDTPDGPSLVLTHTSPDGDEGYPGALTAKVIYTLTNENILRIEMTASTDQPTVVNLTHHSYFNLSGAGQGTILDHEVLIDADYITAVNETLIPTGERMPVVDTPFDFRLPHAIGARIDDDHEQLRIGGGYDHNYVLNKRGEDGLTGAARVTESSSGRIMDVYTTDPGVQFYTGNFLDGSITGKGGAVYPRRSGFCLEPQVFPDAPNQPDFPSAVLRPGEEYSHTIEYRFSAE